MAARRQKALAVIQIRVAPREKGKIKALASIYANGNMSHYMLEAAMDFPRRFLPPRRKTKKKAP